MSGVLAMLFGAVERVVTLPADLSAEHIRVFPTAATASVTFKRNGRYAVNGTETGDWITPRHATIGDSYDVKFDYTGTVTSGAAADNTYIQISADRTWSNTQSIVGVKATSGTWSISRTGIGVALDTATGTLTADCES